MCDVFIQPLQVASLLTDIEMSLRRLPLILAGDLNSLPESAVYVLSPLNLQPKTTAIFFSDGLTSCAVTLCLTTVP